MSLPALVLPAAGASSRTVSEAGVPKGLLAHGDRTWLELQLRAFADVGGTRAIVVLGHHGDAFVERLPFLAEKESEAFGLAVGARVNPTPDEGPFLSLLYGLAATGGQPAFVLPLDVPVPGVAVWMTMADALAGHDAVVPTYEERGGHPVLLSAPMIQRLTGLDSDDPDARLDVQLQQADRVLRMPVRDGRIRMNLNTVDEWRAYLESRGWL